MLSAAVVTPSLSCFGAPLLPCRIFLFPRHLYVPFFLAFFPLARREARALFAFPFSSLSHAREKLRAKPDAVDDLAMLLSRQVIPLTIYVQ